MIAAAAGTFVLRNSRFARKLQVDDRGVCTTSLLFQGREFCHRPETPEFSLLGNGEIISSWVASGNPQLKFAQHSVTKVSHGGEELTLNFDLSGAGKLAVIYTIYPDLAGCIKRLELTAGAAPLVVEKLVLEMFNLAPGAVGNLVPYREQGRVPAEACFTITGSDDLLNFHDAQLNSGYWCGSSIPGPLRYVMCYPHWASGTMYGYSQSQVPFQITLAPGETFRSDDIYLLTYHAPRLAAQPRNDFRELIRRSLPELRAQSGVMYCTWVPFLMNTSEALLNELAPRAQELGFSTLVLDDGWFTGDNYQVDREKFPHGIEAVAAMVNAHQLNFGLWFNIGTDYGARGSRPEDNARDALGRPKGAGSRCRCLASHHRDWVIDQLQNLAHRYHVSYFKLDFSTIVSPYGVLPLGCSSSEHAYHRNAYDAVVRQYQGLNHIGQEVRSSTGALIDFSFEVFGTEAPGVAGLKMGDLQHITNYHTAEGFYPAHRIRSAFYHFAQVLPVERLLGALIEVAGPHYWENLLTSMVMMPLVAGDLRELDAAAVRKIRCACQGFQQISQSGALTELELWCPGGEVQPDQCDGFCRFSRDGRRALLVLFANASHQASMTVKLEFPVAGRYHVRDLSTGKLIAGCTAQELHHGVEVSFNGEEACGWLLTLEGELN